MATFADARVQRQPACPVGNRCGIFQDIPIDLEVALANATVGKWGKNLAVRFPLEIVRAAGLRDGERVEIEARGSDIVIRRPDPQAVADAQAAAEEIIAESRTHPLDKTTIGELLEEGRRG